MKQVLFLLLLATLIGVGFGQSKQDILNNLQRGGALDVQDASPTSSYDVLMWDGDELKLVTITVLGTVFPSLDVAGDITLQNDETISNSVDGRISFGNANLLTTGTLGSGAATVTTITGTGTTTIKTGTGGSATDSSIVINGSSGSPRINFYGTDGDTYSIGINTSDAALFAGAGGGYSFDGALLLPSTVIGEDVFTTTGETDTVTIAGAAATDTYIISGQFTTAVDQQDVLQWEALSGKLVVHRLAAGESALKYSWLRIPTP